MSDEVSSQNGERKIGKIIARNTIFGLGAQFALRVVNFTFTVLIIRNLGDSQFGQYSIVLAWVGLFGVIGDLGINQYPKIVRLLLSGHEQFPGPDTG